MPASLSIVTFTFIFTPRSDSATCFGLPARLPADGQRSLFGLMAIAKKHVRTIYVVPLCVQRDEQNEGAGPGKSTGLDAIAKDARHHDNPSTGHRGGDVRRPIIGQTYDTPFDLLDQLSLREGFGTQQRPRERQLVVCSSSGSFKQAHHTAVCSVVKCFEQRDEWAGHGYVRFLTTMGKDDCPPTNRVG